MNRSKLVAILTGAISLLLAIAYLIVVQLLDFRGEMLPAPPLSTQTSPSIAILDTALCAVVGEWGNGGMGGANNRLGRSSELF